MDNTNDLSKFGHIELVEAEKLLHAFNTKAWASADDDLNNGVKLEFNPSSGNVFLVDDDYMVAMLNGDKLENWLSCPNCGKEGFRSELPLNVNGECAEDTEECRK